MGSLQPLPARCVGVPREFHKSHHGQGVAPRTGFLPNGHARLGTGPESPAPYFLGTRASGLVGLVSSF